MRALMVSAAARSSGKTTVASALAAVLARRGLAVQPFKKGPDFIDPQWLAAAAGTPCRNLDMRLQGAEGVRAYWARHAAADVAIVEGNQGLYDGVDGGSNAALAKLLGLPVVVVMDARGMGRTAAALALGLAAFDRDLRVAGIVLNRVAGSRHEATLRTAIETEAGVRVLGAIPELDGAALVQRHLGLVPPNEAGAAAATIESLAQRVGTHLDVDAILAAAAQVAPAPAPARIARAISNGPRIGIATDRAFGFYYADDLEALQEAGAALVVIDTLRDAHLPRIDGLFLGGGFPETCGRELAMNGTLRAELRQAIDAGLPVYAECGGLMYLTRSLTHGRDTYAMVGAIAADAVMHDKPAGKGYVTLAETASHPWGGTAATIEAHEFHYSTLENVDPRTTFAYRVLRGHGIDGRHDGIVHRNVLASYAHLRSVGGNDWAARFVAHVRRCMPRQARAAA